MIKKFLAKLINWEGVRESDWTKALRASGRDRAVREQTVAEARERLRREQQERPGKQVPATEVVPGFRDK